ncbi:hypothetical protein HQN90_17300 [Paenibacillus alba]|nr:hypothetical protein [Paenibacillus alba]
MKDQQIYTTSPLQATAGVELWKDGYYIDTHSATVNGSGKVEAKDLLDACTHPSIYDYDLYVTYYGSLMLLQIIFMVHTKVRF